MSFILDIISYNKVCACHCRFCQFTFSAGHIGQENISPVIIIVIIVAIVVVIVLVVLATIIIYRCGGFSHLDCNTCCTPIVHYRALILTYSTQSIIDTMCRLMPSSVMYTSKCSIRYYFTWSNQTAGLITCVVYHRV